MTRHAIYYPDKGVIVEQPAVEMPKIILTNDLYSIDYHPEVREYREHIKSLRTIPVHSSARGLWKDGQVLTEGVDYEVSSDEDRIHRAFPLPVKRDRVAHMGAGDIRESEEELWDEFWLNVRALTDFDMTRRTNSMQQIKSKYIITKR